jgi:hypothetical protein
MLLKEHRFMFVAGGETHLFRIEELITGLAGWPSKFRLKIPASSLLKAKTFYGESCNETAAKAVAFVAPKLRASTR